MKAQIKLHTIKEKLAPEESNVAVKGGTNKNDSGI